MKPLIGITSSYSWDNHNQILPNSYVDAIERGGGTPVLLPPSFTIDVEQLLESVDGLVLTGGVDIDPQHYGENPIPQMGTIDPKRDDFELKITKEALRGGKPILAICRGHQVLNVAAGGTLIQDIASQVPEALKHRQKAPTYYPSHTVRVQEGSRLHGIFGKSELGVNTFHHQAVRDMGEGLVATAWAPDGVLEAMEIPGDAFVLGVQWHPERMIDGEMLKIFQGFVQAID
jgi:putative glutamine amidotransferase